MRWPVPASSCPGRGHASPNDIAGTPPAAEIELDGSPSATDLLRTARIGL
jgi:hypothetical protein